MKFLAATFTIVTMVQVDPAAAQSSSRSFYEDVRGGHQLNVMA